MKKGKIEILEVNGIAEKLARKIYSRMGCTVPESVPENYMRDSQHPMEVACYQAAHDAIEMLTT